MRAIFALLSILLAILGFMPWILLQFDEDYFSILLFGITGWISAFLPLIYSVLSFLFALMSERGKLKLLAILLSILAFVWNVAIIVSAFVL